MAGATNSVVAQTTTPLRRVQKGRVEQRLEVGPARTRNEILKELDPLKPLQFAGGGIAAGNGSDSKSGSATGVDGGGSLFSKASSVAEGNH
jgi:hypothetical protein